MVEPRRLAAYELVVSLEQHEFHLDGGADPVVVPSPSRSRARMGFALELWAAEPPLDLAGWEECADGWLRVGAQGLRYRSGGTATELPPVPEGPYALRVSGRGFAGRGWRGPTEPADEWRVQLWPALEARAVTRLASAGASGPDGLSPAAARLVADVARLGEDPADRPAVRELLRDRARAAADPHVRRLALAFLGNHATEAADDAFIRACADADPDPGVRTTAAAMLMSPWALDPENLAWLQSLAVRDAAPEVRVAAVKAVAGGWPRDPDTAAWLIDRARAAEQPDVRWAAVLALGSGWPENGGILPVLREVAAVDGDPDVRRAAVRAVAGGWAKDPAAAPWLREQAAGAEHPDAALAALRAVERAGARDLRSLLPWLQELAGTARLPQVRAAAVGVVAARAGADARTRAWLCDRAERSEHPDVRRAAVHAVGTERADVEFLRSLATVDPDPAVRWAAAAAVGDPAWRTEWTATEKTRIGVPRPADWPSVTSTPAETDAREDS